MLMEMERLRAVALIMVVLFHMSRMVPGSPLSRLGIGSIDLFFVLSGFLISRTLTKAFGQVGVSSALTASENIFRARFELGKFFIRRLFRIIPAAGSWILICAGIALWFNQSGAAGSQAQVWSHLISLATLTFNYVMPSRSIFGPYWTLMIEEHFYLVVPWIFLFLPNVMMRMRVLGLTVLAIMIARTFANGTFPDIFFRDIFRFDSLLSGSLVFHFFHYRKDFASKAMGQRAGLILSLTAVFVIWFISFFMDPARFERETILISVCVSSLLVWLAAKNENLVLNIPKVRTGLEYLGTRSYSLYLIHEPLRVFFVEGNFRTGVFGETSGMGKMPLFWLAYFLLLMCLGEISYRFIERPFLSFGRHWAERVGPSRQKEESPCVG
ncbi:MAG: acyltransferase [Bdellovibrionales bacterium]|nr:acyltransferase [Bdellovibrionales bacterium]